MSIRQLPLFAMLLTLVCGCKQVTEVEIGHNTANEDEKVDYKNLLSIVPSKMDVLYIGVDNPIKIETNGADPSNMRVSCAGAGCNMTGRAGAYVIKVSSPGVAKIMASIGGDYIVKKLRVKRLPNPIASLDAMGKMDGSISKGEFLSKRGIYAVLQNFDYDARCIIQEYSVTRLSTDKRIETVRNDGYAYSETTLPLVQRAGIGDTFLFRNIMARCPGDLAGRKLNPMVWDIK